LGSFWAAWQILGRFWAAWAAFGQLLGSF